MGIGGGFRGEGEEVGVRERWDWEEERVGRVVVFGNGILEMFEMSWVFGWLWGFI